MLLLTLSVGAAAPHKGAGCWRGKPMHTMTAAARSLSDQAGDNTSPFFGKKRGLVILAEFTDVAFKTVNDREKYDNIMNAKGYTTTEGFRGSVADYFRDQSNGQFELTFDVLGPFSTEHDFAYYGTNNSEGYDLLPHEMIIEMCHAADSLVDFADYDWDGDGEVDEIFVVYAGKGEADGGKTTTIWPHMWSLEEAAGETLTLDGTVINIYACANELDAKGAINGIGTFCHEFSHCLGLPDFYSTIGASKSVMGSFDLMDQGVYNGGGFCPPSFTAYEKMVCGWQMPIVLDNEDVYVDGIAPISENGQTYIIYNDACPDEFYTIENRQSTGWDKSFPTKGLLITHVDYDEYLWLYNYPNSVISDLTAQSIYGYEKGNDHARMTFFHANDKDLSPKLYPYLQNDSLTATSNPAAILYNNNSLGTKQMMGSILDIHANDDGTMGFFFRAVNPIVTGVHIIEAPTLPQRIYTLDGREAGTPLESLPHGIYIIDGKKVVH